MYCAGMARSWPAPHANSLAAGCLMNHDLSSKAEAGPGGSVIGGSQATALLTVEQGVFS